MPRSSTLCLPDVIASNYISQAFCLHFWEFGNKARRSSYLHSCVPTHVQIRNKSDYRITFNWLEMKLLWALPTWLVQLPSSEIGYVVVEELHVWTLGRPSTVALQPELWSTVIFSLCEGTSIEVTCTCSFRANINFYLILILEVKRTDWEKLAAAK